MVFCFKASFCISKTAPRICFLSFWSISIQFPLIPSLNLPIAHVPLPVFVLLLHLSINPFSIWQMSVVRGHMVVIRRVLPRHWALLPVSNLRENRLQFRQPWKQLLASRLRLQTLQYIKVLLTCLQSLNIYHIHHSYTLPFPFCFISRRTAELQGMNAKGLALVWWLTPTVSTEL